MPPGRSAVSEFTPKTSPPGNHDSQLCVAASHRCTAVTLRPSPATASATGVVPPCQRAKAEFATSRASSWAVAVAVSSTSSGSASAGSGTSGAGSSSRSSEKTK